jgi:gluconate 2-dehydrogenase gamma chain
MKSLSSKTDSMDTGRRSFLAGASGALVAFAALDWHPLARAAAQAQQMAAGPDPQFTVLSKAQAAMLDAITSRIVPTDELPGAHEAGVVFFIDLALGSFFASSRAEFLEDLADFETAAAKAGAAFTALDAEAQDRYLKTVETTPFFGQLRTWTLFGLLASPMYGGNRGQLGWKLVGMEEAHRFEPPFGYYDRDYPGFEPYPPEEDA